MTDATARQAHEVFMKTLDVEPEGVDALLDAECGDDTVLRGEVEALIRAQQTAGVFLERPVRERISVRPAALDRPSLLGRRIGKYTLDEEIASGGVGTVFLATQQNPNRSVAVKLLTHGRTSRSAQRRFEYESEILARLQHPNIAQVYESGIHDDGLERLPYFAMEYIADARTITSYAEEHALSVRDRLRLFVKVCDAVTFANQRGIIHRDLKPANILVDATGEPKVIDFGIARITDLDHVMTTRHTDLGQIIGTLAYMSPEQIDSEQGDIDVRSDVYSLGVVLFELLCARLPTSVDKSSLFKAARSIHAQTPDRPSTINRALRGDVETLLLKAMEKDRNARYSSAQDMGEDIRRYLDNLPIRAKPPSMMYLVGKFTRRHRVMVVAVAVVALALIGAVIVSTVFAVQSNRESVRRFAAERDARIAEQQAARQRDEARWQAYIANIAAAESAHSLLEYRRMRNRLDLAQPELRGWEWRYLNRLSDQSRDTLAHEDRVMSVEFSPDGTQLVTACTDGRLRIWARETGRLLKTFTGHESDAYCVAVHPSGDRIASGGIDQSLRLWDLETGKQLMSLTGHRDSIMDVAFSDDGSLIATAAWDNTARLWDTETGALVHEMKGHANRLRAVTFMPDGKRVVTSSDDRTIRVWDIETGAALQTLDVPTGEIREIAVSPDGTRLAAGAGDFVLRVWETDTWKLLHEKREHGNIVWSVAFSPDGALLASGSADQTIRIWNAHSLELINVLPGHGEVIQSMMFSPDSRLLASASWDGTAKIWETNVLRDDFSVLKAHASFIYDLSYSHDGSMLASCSSDERIRIWNPRTLEPIATFDGGHGVVQGVTFSPDQTTLATCGVDGMIRLWNLYSGRLVRTLRGHSKTVNALDYSPDGRRLVSASDDGTARIWDTESGETLHVLQGHTGIVWRVAYSPDGSLIATGAKDETVRLWDADAGAHRITLDGHEDNVYALVFSADGRRLYSGTREQNIYLWDVSTGQKILTRAGHGQFVTGMALLPDQSRLVSTSMYQTIKFWSTDTMDDVLTLRGLAASVRSLAVEPDGTRVLTGTSDGRIQLLDTLSPRERTSQKVRARADMVRAEQWLHEHFGTGFDPARLDEEMEGEESMNDELRQAIRWVVLKWQRPRGMAKQDQP